MRHFRRDTTQMPNRWLTRDFSADLPPNVSSATQAASLAQRTLRIHCLRDQMHA